MDGIHDMGGMQGFGRTKTPQAGPPFAEPWGTMPPGNRGTVWALGV